MGRLWASCVSLVVFVGACSLLNERRPAHVADAGTDAGTDAGGDAAIDAGTDAGTDAGGDAAIDAPPVDACARTCGSRACGDDGCGGVCGTCSGSTACDGTGTCAAPILVDHFDNLASWANTTNSTTAWTIDASGHVGTGAKSQVGGAGFGDQLQRTIAFPTASTLRIWANKMNNDFITVRLKVDGAVAATYQGDMNGFGVWLQLEVPVPAGSHVIRIESDLAGTAWVDELEVFSTP